MEVIKSYVPVLLVTLIIVGLGYFSYDLMFSKPDHLIGTIIEKIFVAPRTTSGIAPYGGIRRSTYTISAQKEEQWIAIVLLEAGDTLTVHCLPKHYSTKNVGDIIHFKKYEGKHFHIQYFAHNEEEE